MRYPYFVKVNDKYIKRTNLQDRQEAIRDIGEKDFFSDKRYEHLWDLQVPLCYLYIFNVFIDLYSACVEKITYRDIESYCNVRHCTLKQVEIEMLYKMNSWANDEINKLQEEV